jgi:hypothetical protein
MGAGARNSGLGARGSGLGARGSPASPLAHDHTREAPARLAEARLIKCARRGARDSAVGYGAYVLVARARHSGAEVTLARRGYSTLSTTSGSRPRSQMLGRAMPIDPIHLEIANSLCQEDVGMCPRPPALDGGRKDNEIVNALFQ